MKRTGGVYLRHTGHLLFNFFTPVFAVCTLVYVPSAIQSSIETRRRLCTRASSESALSIASLSGKRVETKKPCLISIGSNEASRCQQSTQFASFSSNLCLSTLSLSRDAPLNNMPPRRAPPASPAKSVRQTVEPSPAPSTRSTRRRPAADDTDDWERESVVR